MNLTSLYVTAAVSILGLAYLIFLARKKRWARRALAAIAVSILAVICTYFWIMRPLNFPKTYADHARQPKHINIAKHASRQEFFVGAAVYRPNDIAKPSFQKSFNSVTPANALKLGALNTDLNEMTYDFTKGDAYIQLARSHNLRVRGHTLIFGKLSDVYREPDLEAWLARFANTAEKQQKLNELLQRHIKIVMEHYKDDIQQWDVVNEPLEMFGDGNLEENVFYRYLGESYIAEAFRLARRYAPDAKLFVNEQFNNYTGPKAQAFVKWLEAQLDAGVPIDGVGLQGHRLFYLETPENTRAYIQSIVDLGLDVEITELDARLRLFKDKSDPYLAQGEYYRDIIKACFDIKGCRGVTFWGFSDRDAWHDELSYMFAKPNEPYLFDHKGIAKPGVNLINQYFSQLKSIKTDR